MVEKLYDFMDNYRERGSVLFLLTPLYSIITMEGESNANINSQRQNPPLRCH